MPVATPAKSSAAGVDWIGPAIRPVTTKFDVEPTTLFAPSMIEKSLPFVRR